MAVLGTDEIRVLNAIDMIGATRASIIPSLRPVWDDLVRRGYIEERISFALTQKGQEAIEAHESIATGDRQKP